MNESQDDCQALQCIKSFIRNEVQTCLPQNVPVLLKLVEKRENMNRLVERTITSKEAPAPILPKNSGHGKFKLLDSFEGLLNRPII